MNGKCGAEYHEKNFPQIPIKLIDCGQQLKYWLPQKHPLKSEPRPYIPILVMIRVIEIVAGGRVLKKLNKRQ